MPVCCLKKREKYHVELKPSVLPISATGMSLDLSRFFALCGVAWCAPWEADISRAVRTGRNEIEIRYTNNWHNRLVGDCFLPDVERVTRSTVRCWNVPRAKSDPARPWLELPTVYSGVSVSDKLQPSGILGPVSVVFRSRAAAPISCCRAGVEQWSLWTCEGTSYPR